MFFLFLLLKTVCNYGPLSGESWIVCYLYSKTIAQRRDQLDLKYILAFIIPRRLCLVGACVTGMQKFQKTYKEETQ